MRGYFRLYETWEGDLDGSLQTLHGESLWGAPGLLGPYLGQITSRQMALAYLQEQLERDFQEIEEAAARRLVTGRQAG